jgi:hypothetical protein
VALIINDDWRLAATIGADGAHLGQDDGELAAVLTHLRSAWGHQAAPVSALDVQQLRGGARP